MSRQRPAGIAFVLTIAAAMPAAAQKDYSGLPLSCIGTEPFWDMTIAGGQATMSQPEGGPFLWTASPGMSAQGRWDMWVIQLSDPQASPDAPGFAGLQYTGQCSDGMSDNIFPFEVIMLLPDGRVLGGCCGALD